MYRHLKQLLYLWRYVNLLLHLERGFPVSTASYSTQNARHWGPCSCSGWHMLSILRCAKYRLAEDEIVLCRHHDQHFLDIPRAIWLWQLCNMLLGHEWNKSQSSWISSALWWQQSGNYLEIWLVSWDHDPKSTWGSQASWLNLMWRSPQDIVQLKYSFYSRSCQMPIVFPYPNNARYCRVRISILYKPVTMQ